MGGGGGERRKFQGEGGRDTVNLNAIFDCSLCKPGSFFMCRRTISSQVSNPANARSVDCSHFVFCSICLLSVPFVHPFFDHLLYLLYSKLITTMIQIIFMFKDVWAASGNQHHTAPVKLKTWFVFIIMPTLPLTTLICLLANKVWRGILIKLGLIKVYSICIMQGHSLSIYKLRKPGYLLVETWYIFTKSFGSLSSRVYIHIRARQIYISQPILSYIIISLKWHR